MIILGTVIHSKRFIQKVLNQADLIRESGGYVNEGIYKQLSGALEKSFLGVVTYPSRKE